ncbi:conserved hypothetical protein [Ricinus communis]|uniref:Uncharacterized protein n=1 Tax=Ricinus communis TaxID=3988 RepID=B9S5H6_RICCO|nr:conserved hypothetical protein [Ricinus communis]
MDQSVAMCNPSRQTTELVASNELDVKKDKPSLGINIEQCNKTEGIGEGPEREL